MPGFDGTGPAGRGSRTGGGFGFCSPGAGPAPAGSARGVGYGVGRGGFPWGGGRGRTFGGGRGRWRRVGFSRGSHPYWAGPATPVAGAPDEKTFLEDELAYLEQQLTSVKSRLAEMEAAAE